MKYLLSFLILFTYETSAFAQSPDAQKILNAARLSTTLTNVEEGLEGALHQGTKKVPITLFLRGEDIQFQYTEEGVQRVFHTRMAAESFQLFEMKNGKTLPFPEKKLTESISGTDLSYEDLALRFFYWPDPILEGSESIAGQSCYRIRLKKPSNVGGRYAGVYVWIHEKYGAFMRIRGHDQSGALLKEFQVEDVMKVGNDTWVLKKMKVSTYDPKSQRRLSITDLIFKNPSSKVLRGLR